MTIKKILVVDIDPAARESLSQLLRPYKFQVVTAADGQEAYDKFKEERPDLIILEAILPKIHGFELTERITSETKGRTPVIIVTGAYRGPQYRNEALTTFGASDYFEKPFDREKFINSVLNLLKEDSEIWLDLPSPDEVASFLFKKAGLAGKAKKP
ncbi:MAG: response regulator [Candidatus Aminicenantes bacterium]|nr:response regulator [Candidatus Aminicenantes bacterium]